YLGKTKDKKAIEPLFQMLQKEEFRDVCISALRALVMIDGDEVLEKFIKLLSGKNQKAKELSIDGIGYIGKERGIKAIIKLLKDPNWRIRRAVVESLGMTKNKNRKTRDALIPALSDKNEQVRLTSLKALSGIYDDKVIDHIILALKDRNLWVRFKAAEILGEMNVKRAVDPLIKLFEKDKGITRVAVVKALGVLKEKRSMEVLMKAIEDNNEDVKKTALEALRNIES
ncbi:MAG TPA: HEAT repeat domain-containing protein, partial [Nitrospinota bacterium]|nr:HEAT repeat domain-containing protein [Nitrospinota bacterium]